jgi:transcriptional regulator with XRE-family HTH domain
MEELKALRLDRKMSRAVLAFRAGLSMESLRRAERGDGGLRLESAKRLADVLKCSLDELAGRVPPKAA